MELLPLSKQSLSSVSGLGENKVSFQDQMLSTFQISHRECTDSIVWRSYYCHLMGLFAQS